MKSLRKAMHNLNRNLAERDQHPSIPFEKYLTLVTADPKRTIRNIFQVFADMFEYYIGTGHDEYPDDPESINYVSYDTSKLFVEGADHPFFADRLFANRLVNHVEALKVGAQQNKIYIFEGPHGSGKSTFFNNLIRKFEEFANTDAGMMYEVVWRFPRKLLGDIGEAGPGQLAQHLAKILAKSGQPLDDSGNHPDRREIDEEFGDDHVEVSCPSHDNPLLIIPKHYRRQFFDDVLDNDELKWKLFTGKEYEWIFQQTSCTICSSLYDALIQKLRSPLKVLGRVYARPYVFNRRLGAGISVFNPGDPPIRQHVCTNSILQQYINSYLNDSNRVKYIFSNYAKTNNGIYALMDIKTHNKERLIELHNIISEGVHKVEDIEENVHSLFFALMNPEDRKNFEDIQSFADRITYIRIPYVLDLKTEVAIYKNIFGKHIQGSFLPTVLHNFARVIIATRLNHTSKAMADWIPDPDKYSLYCDKELMLLKMEIYTGYIPTWLDEEDRRRLNAKRRRQIIAESETEGRQGYSGRDSIRIFNEFFSAYAKSDKLINMEHLRKFFMKYLDHEDCRIPEGFLDSLMGMYNYKILQEVKESLYYYNEQQITREIQNYLFAINFELGETVTCKYTGDQLDITENYLEGIETKLLVDKKEVKRFRETTQREYTSTTLTQEMMRDGLSLPETTLYQSLHERYIHNLKEKVLNPFLKNENFRRAIKEYDKEAFKTYDKKIRDDVKFLIDNLCRKYGYTPQGAKEVCVYVIDNNLAPKFALSGRI